MRLREVRKWARKTRSHPVGKGRLRRTEAEEYHRDGKRKVEIERRKRRNAARRAGRQTRRLKKKEAERESPRPKGKEERRVVA